jgi:AraC family transcriptional regulator of adaptative response / DNA-3-methyladenine glycosylase II
MELPSGDVCYRALQSGDERFDGLILVGVTSTEIYCRPICPARIPKYENCVFYSSSAASQNAGFRSCLRCRPESAPDLASWRVTSNTVARALALIAEGALDSEGDKVDALANRLVVGERQLRRLFLQHLGASPTSVAQTRRLLFAKQLIHETEMSMTEIALASGFGSVRRFNEIFQELFRRPPSALRRAGRIVREETGNGLSYDFGISRHTTGIPYSTSCARALYLVLKWLRATGISGLFRSTVLSVASRLGIYPRNNLSV